MAMLSHQMYRPKNSFRLLEVEHKMIKHQTDEK